jgi:hypothetical protein
MAASMSSFVFRSIPASPKAEELTIIHLWITRIVEVYEFKNINGLSEDC